MSNASKAICAEARAAPPRRGSRSTTMRWALAALLVLLPSAARAGELEDRFGSDEANVENLRALAELLGPGSHAHLRGGVWLANLSRGPGAAFQGSGTPIDGETPAQAATRIGAGSGLVREFGLELAVKGNEAFFDFLSDKLFSAAEDEVTKRVENEYVRDGILMIAGELRPDLKSILGEDAKAWLGVSYGDLKGRIDDASHFVARDGVPYFAGKTAEWRTRYFMMEAGVFYEADKAESVEDGWSTAARFGLYGRYLNFSMPTVIGFGAQGQGEDNVLQTAELSGGGLGGRMEVSGCNYVCMTLDASVIPLLGYTSLDLGPWGVVPGFPFILTINPGLAVPIPIGNVMVLRPYASFRLDWMALVGSGDIATSSSGGVGGDGGFLTEPSIPDFLTWGPRFGMAIEL